MKPGFELVENVGGMLKDVPKLTFTYVKQELGRFAGRFKSKLAKERMSGAPGINWFGAKTLKNSKHFRYYVEGNSIQSLAMVSKVSGILMMHETGGTIRAKSGGWLYIFDRRLRYAGKRKKWNATMSSATQSGIVARVKQVTLKPRLQFRATFKSMVPEERTRLNNTVDRAVKVARERNLSFNKIMMNTRL